MAEISVSKQLFYELSKKLKGNIAHLSVSETDKWCGFYQQGGKRFAYILLAKKKPKIEIWCLGDSEIIKPKYSSILNFKQRQETTGGFGKDFQINFVIDDFNQIEQAAVLLSEISNSWTRADLMAAFNLYCKIPVQEISISNKKIIEFAELLEKSPKEVAKRFLNFTKAEAFVGIDEIDANDDKRIVKDFNENWGQLAYESESKLIDFENKLNRIKTFPQGKERETVVKTRVNQSFFRNAVLTSYHNKCCITSLPFVEMLNASHIIPWAVDEQNRLNPHNGLSLNALHDRAFDKGFITITTDYKVKISKNISQIIDNQSVKELFLKFENKSIHLPNRFIPEKSFLEYHHSKIFKQ